MTPEQLIAKLEADPPFGPDAAHLIRQQQARIAELETSLRMANCARTCPNCGGEIDAEKGHCLECIEQDHERDRRIAELEEEVEVYQTSQAVGMMELEKARARIAELEAVVDALVALTAERPGHPVRIWRCGDGHFHCGNTAERLIMGSERDSMCEVILAAAIRKGADHDD